MAAVIPLSEKDVGEVKRLAKYYVGVCGLTHAQAAAVVNSRNKELFKKAGWDLNKSKVVGICHRGGVTRASTYTDEGKELLKEVGMEIYASKKGLSHSNPHSNGIKNKLKNASLRGKTSSRDSNLPVPEEDEVRPTPNKFRKSAGFISARERRQRCLTHLEPESGRHLPRPDAGLTAKDIQDMERFFTAHL